MEGNFHYIVPSHRGYCEKIAKIPLFASYGMSHPNVAAVALANKNARIILATAGTRSRVPGRFPIGGINSGCHCTPEKIAVLNLKEHFADCYGNQDVIARQVSSWQAKPKFYTGSVKRQRVCRNAGIFHQGQRRSPRSHLWLQSLPA